MEKILYQDNGTRNKWWRITKLIDTFNENRKEYILPCEITVIDESMSAFRPQSTKTGGLPVLTFEFIIRKPEDLGTEFKTVVCPVLGVMMYIELQQGKEGMKSSRYNTEYGATTGCTLRCAEGVSRRTGNEPEEIVTGDSWFGSVKAAAALKQKKFECILQVKQNSSLFPKKQLEELLEKAPGGTSVVLSGIHPTGTHLISIGYKYNKSKVLNFVCTPGAGTTLPGKPYEMKWSDKFGNVNVRKVPRPSVISKFFNNCNSVDVHNHLRQYCLRLEKKWITTDCWFRIFTTILGINVVDTFRLAKFHRILPNKRFKIVEDVDHDGQNDYTMRKFGGVLCTQLLYMASQYERGAKTMFRNNFNPGKGEGEKKGKRPKNQKQNYHSTIVYSSEETQSANPGLFKKYNNLNGRNAVRGKGTSALHHKNMCASESSSSTDGYDSVSVEAEDELAWMDGPKRMANTTRSSVVCEMIDAGGRRHTAVKLPLTKSKGSATFGRPYTKRRKCKWCKDRSTVYCVECNMPFCFPVRDESAISDSCFCLHVKYTSKKSILKKREHVRGQLYT